MVVVAWPHHSTTYVDAACCYRPSSVVCLSVGLSVSWSVTRSEPCKNGWTDRDVLWVVDSDGPKKPCVRWGVQIPVGKGQFWGRKGRPIV